MGSVSAPMHAVGAPYKEVVVQALHGRARQEQNAVRFGCALLESHLLCCQAQHLTENYHRNAMIHSFSSDRLQAHF
eukprot:230472-Amphidinium_carterae.1